MGNGVEWGGWKEVGGRENGKTDIQRDRDSFYRILWGSASLKAKEEDGPRTRQGVVVLEPFPLGRGRG